MSSSTQDSDRERSAPDYSVPVEVSELLADLAEKAANTARRHASNARNWQEDDWWQYRQWMQQDWKKMRAYSTAIAMLQTGNHGTAVPRGEFVAEDGTVNVREYMSEISRLGESAHNRGAHEAESAYARVTSLLRNEYGVGWPRLDDLGGNPLEEDLP